MSSYVPCAVPGCEDRKSSRHRFPNPEKDKDRFQRWITAVANSKLVNLESKQIYNNYRVCHQHFTEKDTSTNMYLKRIAVPSQKLSIISVPSAKDEVYLEKPTSPNSESQLPETSVQPEEVAVTHSETAQKVPEEGSAALPRTPPPSTSRETLLKSVNVSRSIELSPKARCLYQKARKLQNVCAVYKKRTRSLKQRMQAARTNAHLFDYSQSSLRTEAVNFCIQQLRRKVTKRRGQRFSLEEKLMSLALYKTAGAGYRFMSKWFNLPSKRTLTRLLQNIPVDEGINQFVMQNLKASCQHLKSRERLCLLLFDEVALMPSLTYNKHKDTLVGIKNGELADHALVFMVRGITRKWKQTLLYNFCKGTTKSSTIKSLVISLIRELKKSGLVVIATVCDQGSTNRSAIESMIADSRAQYLKNDKTPKRRIIVDESEVIPLYDVPHLVKGLQNNLLEKDLIWQKQDTVYVAKWEDIVNAYYIDSSENIRCIPKITECHVIKGKLKKMKVSCATQVFSHSMAAAISIMARNEESDTTGEHKMDKRARETAQVIKFLDTVFDSLNGGTYTGHPGKPLKGAVRKNSEHVSFWREAICSMKNMYFRKEGTQQNIIPPSLKNFIITLEGFIDLTEVLLKKVPYFLTRSVNQDPLENYFGQIRQHRGRHTNPSCAQFEDSYRALLIRSISGTHSAIHAFIELFQQLAM